MRTVTIIVSIALSAVTIACGYGNKYMTSAATMPVIAKLNPGSVSAGGPAFTMTITGSNFISQAIVNWNGNAQTAGTTFVNAGQLTLSVPAAAIMNSATIQITVTNPATQGPGYGSGGTPAETSMPMNFVIH